MNRRAALPRIYFLHLFSSASTTLPFSPSSSLFHLHILLHHAPRLYQLISRAPSCFVKGVDVLANAVSITLGPKGSFSYPGPAGVFLWFADVSRVGRNVIIEQSFGGPKITKGKSSSHFAFDIRFLLFLFLFYPEDAIALNKGAFNFLFSI